MKLSIVLALVILASPPATLDKSKKTSADLVSLARALRSYRNDHGAYPVIRSGTAKLLQGSLEPKYLKRVPPRDAWGHSIRVDVSRNSYTLWSNGADGRQDASWQVARTLGPECDIVIKDGAFFQYPAAVGSQGDFDVKTPYVRETCPPLPTRVVH